MEFLARVLVGRLEFLATSLLILDTYSREVVVRPRAPNRVNSMLVTLATSASGRVGTAGTSTRLPSISSFEVTVCGLTAKVHLCGSSCTGAGSEAVPLGTNRCQLITGRKSSLKYKFGGPFCVTSPIFSIANPGARMGTRTGLTGIGITIRCSMGAVGASIFDSFCALMGRGACADGGVGFSGARAEPKCVPNNRVCLRF